MVRPVRPRQTDRLNVRKPGKVTGGTLPRSSAQLRRLAAKMTRKVE